MRTKAIFFCFFLALSLAACRKNASPVSEAPVPVELVGHQTDSADTLRTKAEKGDATAQRYLGSCYRDGIGVDKDYAEAVKWYRKAAEQNDTTAQNCLAGCYSTGNGVNQDFAKAVMWWRKAAERGDMFAQSMLGYAYSVGIGVEKDYEEAYAWYNLAAKTHSASGKDRDGLERKMSPQQVAAAQKRTKDLRAAIDANLKNAGK